MEYLNEVISLLTDYGVLGKVGILLWLIVNFVFFTSLVISSLLVISDVVFIATKTKVTEMNTLGLFGLTAMLWSVLIIVTNV